MLKNQKEKKRRKPDKHMISRRDLSLRTLKSSVHQRIQNEKERMLSFLNFDEHLHGQVEDMFDINLEGLPAGKEPVFFSTAVFKIDSAELAKKKIEKLPDIDLSNEDKNGTHYVWTRAYPKGHWNPMSTIPSARQVIGNIHVNFDNTLKLETKTKGWMTGLIYYMIDTFGKNIKLINLEFQNPLDMLRK